MARFPLVARQFAGVNTGSGSSSSACPGCGRSLDLFSLPLSDPGTGATLAFAVLNLVALLALFILACLARRFVTRDGRTRTRFGLLWALGFFFMYQLLDIVNVVMTSRPGYVPAGYLIMYPFWNFFAVATDVTLVWTLFGFLYARMHALRGDSRSAKGTRTAGIVMVSICAPLALAYIVIYCMRIASSLRGSIGLSTVRLINIMSAIGLTFDGIRLALSIAYFSLGLKVFTDYRRSSNFSKIPTILLATTWPFAFFTALADVIIDVVINYTGAYTSANIGLAQEFTRGVFKVIVLAGLVAAARCHDWALPPDAGQAGYGMHPQPYGPHGPAGHHPAGYGPVHQGSSYPPSYGPGPAASEMGYGSAPAGGYREPGKPELDASQYRPVASQPAPAELNSPRRF